MSFGMFEANVTSEDENKRQVREAANKLAAATYDVRERFGQFLFAARDLTEYNDRLALSKNDILKTIEPHVFPRTGTVRRVLKPLENEFKAIRRQADASTDKLYEMMGVPAPSTSLKEDPFAGGGFDPTKIPGVTNSPNNTPVADPTGGLLSGPITGDYPSSTTVNGKPSGGDTATTTTTTTPGTPGSAGGGAGASSWSANSNTDPIGPGEYKIQQGDTYSNLAQRAGWGDDYKGFAQATGYQADNPDMIYAGDTMNVKAKPGSESSASTSTTDTTSPSTTPNLAAEAPTSASASASPAEESGPKPGASPAALRRRADFERNLDTDVTFSPSHDELEPEGDFKGYLDDVSQGAEGKVDRDFGGTFPGGTDHDGDPAKTDFTKDATRRFAMWCKANNTRPTLAALDDYQPSDREYIFIAAGLQRLANRRTAAPGYTPTAPKPVKPKGVEWTSKGKPKANTKPDLGPQLPSNPGGSTGTTMPGATTDTKMARKHYASLCRSQGIRPTETGFRRWAAASRRRTAAPDYLQKADEALTNLLNQKAEEFQQTIAPLQQALQTVQQAEQEAQAASPLNVMPPAGTVNVLPTPPGGDPGAAGGAGGGADPLAALMGGGGAPGGDPSGGADPMAAMGGGDPSQDPTQQMVARRGKARGGASPRTAKNVEDLWDQFAHSETLRGGEPDVETFAAKYRVGPKALKRIRQKTLGG